MSYIVYKMKEILFRYFPAVLQLAIVNASFIVLYDIIPTVSSSYTRCGHQLMSAPTRLH